MIINFSFGGELRKAFIEHIISAPNIQTQHTNVISASNVQTQDTNAKDVSLSTSPPSPPFRHFLSLIQSTHSHFPSNIQPNLCTPSRQSFNTSPLSYNLRTQSRHAMYKRNVQTECTNARYKLNLHTQPKYRSLPLNPSSLAPISAPNLCTQCTNAVYEHNLRTQDTHARYTRKYTRHILAAPFLRT